MYVSDFRGPYKHWNFPFSILNSLLKCSPNRKNEMKADFSFSNIALWKMCLEETDTWNLPLHIVNNLKRRKMISEKKTAMISFESERRRRNKKQYFPDNPYLQKNRMSRVKVGESLPLLFFSSYFDHNRLTQQWSH